VSTTIEEMQSQIGFGNPDQSSSEDDTLENARLEKILKRAEQERDEQHPLATPTTATNEEPLSDTAQSDNDLETFELISHQKTTNEEMMTEHHILKVRVVLKDEDYAFATAIADAVKSVVKDFRPNDFVGLRIITRGNDNDIFIPYVRKSQFTTEMIFTQIFGAAQSHREFFNEHVFTVDVTRVVELEGRGSRFKQNCTLLNYNSVFPAKNGKNRFVRDYLHQKGRMTDENSVCLLFAVVCGLEYIMWCESKAKVFPQDFDKQVAIQEMREADQRWRRARDQTGVDFGRLVIQFMEKVNDDFENGANFDLLNRVQDVLGESYKLIVYNGRSDDSKIFGTDYQPGDESRKKLFLYLDENNHFHTLKHPAALFGRLFFCQFCEKSTNNRKHAKCKGSICTKCESHCKTANAEIVNIDCDQCNLRFKTDKCYQKHKEKQICTQRKVCGDCGFLFEAKKLNNESHKCYTRWCSSCKRYSDMPHFCFVKKAKRPENLKAVDANTFLVLADFECTQEDRTFVAGVEKHRHKVNLVHLQVVCARCRELEYTETDTGCIKCEKRGHTIHNFDDESINVVSEMLKHINKKCSPRTLANGHKMNSHDAVVLFHNFRGIYIYIFFVQLSNL